MPTYEYECDTCHHHFEVTQGYGDPQPEKCPECQGTSLHRVYSCAGIIFKGKGFYCTDKGTSGSPCDSCTHNH